MSLRDASDAARRSLGNVTVAIESARDAWRWQWLEEVRQDVAYGLRTFRRAPLFVMTVVGTIGLGLGLLAAAFTLFDTYVLRPVQVRDPYSLYEARWHSRDGDARRFTWTEFRTLQTRRDIFSEAFAYADHWSRLRGSPATGQLVSGNYFELLGVPPALGRMLLPSDAEVPGAGAVIVISHRTWRTMFGGDSAIIGTTTRIGGVPLEIVGVAREGFGGLSETPFDYWIPITMIGTIGPATDLFTHPTVEGVHIVGRIAPAVGVPRARAMLASWLGTETSTRPVLERVNDVDLTSRATLVTRSREAIELFAPIAIAFLLVLLVACANVANMMLARGMARQREVGIRLALGAGRSRLVRQLLTEALLLAVPAGLASYLISRAVLEISVDRMVASTPAAYRAYLRIVPFETTSRVVLFMILAAVLVTLLFGLVPALQATRPNIVQASRGDFEAGHRPSSLRNALVIAQVGFSVVLLICAGVLLSTAQQTARIDPGVRVAGVVQMQVLESRRVRAIETLHARSDVRVLASAQTRPIDGFFPSLPIIAAEKPVENFAYNLVSPEYFSALEIPIIAGRSFTTEEALGHAPVAIVSEATARRMWPDRSPIGERLVQGPTAPPYGRTTAYRSARVIGVSRNAVPGLIPKGLALPTVYYPQPLDESFSNLVVQTTGDAEHERAALEHALATAVDSDAVIDVHTLEASQALQVYPFRVAYWVASAIGMIALLLTLSGIYAVLAYLVEQRRREFGIRLALGGTGPALIALVLRQSVRLSMIGLVIGVVLALGFSRLLMSMVKVVDAFNPGGYASGALLVFVACLLASYVPARHAALIDPAETLRADS